MNIKANILLFSVFNPGLNSLRTNLENHTEVLGRLTKAGVTHIQMLSKNHGVAERSILVIGFEHEGLVNKIANEFHQESYLRSHNDRFSELVHLKGGPGGENIVQPGGKFTPVPK